MSQMTRAVVEYWRLTNVVTPMLGVTGNVVRIPSTAHPKLLTGKRYWVYISVPQPASAIAWLSYGLDYAGPGLVRREE